MKTASILGVFALAGIGLSVIAVSTSADRRADAATNPAHTAAIAAPSPAYQSIEPGAVAPARALAHPDFEHDLSRFAFTAPVAPAPMARIVADLDNLAAEAIAPVWRAPAYLDTLASELPPHFEAPSAVAARLAAERDTLASELPLAAALYKDDADTLASEAPPPAFTPVEPAGGDSADPSTLASEAFVPGGPS